MRYRSPLLVLLLIFATTCACDDGDSADPGDDTLAGDTATSADTDPADTTGTDAPDGTDSVEPDSVAPDTTAPDTVSDTAADTVTDTDACAPSCAGRQCGDDGCGGSCGPCDDTQTCNEAAGVCETAACPADCTSDCPQGCFALGDCAASSELQLDAWPSVRTAGLVLSDATDALPETAEVYYRAVGATTWSRGHDATRIPDGRLALSLFWLAPASAQEVMVRPGDGRQGCATLQTLAAVPEHQTLSTLHVDASAGAGGDGSAAAPFGSIAAALAQADAGTDIVVAAGVYRESLSIGLAGEPGRYVRLLGEPGAVLDGSDPAASAPAWQADGANVWRTPWSGAPSYLSRDGVRSYHYLDLQGLRDGLGKGGVAIDEGWFVQDGFLYVRSLDDPAGHSWQIPALGTAFGLDGAAWIWIEGFEVRHYGEGAYPKGVDVRASSHVVVRGNHIHSTPAPVWVRRGSSHVRVEGNELNQSSIYTWPWSAVKATDHENSAISFAGAESQLAGDNYIHDIFNGVATGSFGALSDASIAFDVDVWGNRIERIGDDGLEPEGATINNRFWGNTIDHVHNGISLAPVTVGPVWVLRNRVTDYAQSGFKVSNSSSGRVWLYHNTSWTDRAETNGMGVSGPFENMVFRNNIVRGTRYALEMGLTTGPNDLDYDNLYTPRGAPVLKWQDVRYDSVAELCTATGLECHGQPEAPGLDDPGAGRFALRSDSPNIDAGVHLWGVNDGFAGEAPDIGYVELGASEP